MKKYIAWLIVFSAGLTMGYTLTPTKIYDRNWQALLNPAKRIAINEGGTSSSKTFSIIQLLSEINNHRIDPLLSSIVSESFPHLQLGAIRDFRKIMGDSFDENKWNATNHVYTFSPDVQMEFFSADQPGKAHGPRRDILFCNEVNNIPKLIVDALSIRTRRFEFYDFNPVQTFWVHELQDRSDVEWIHSTYLDAKHCLPKQIIDKIEARRETDPNWWRVYGLGLVGKLEGLVHPIFTQCDMMPQNGICFFGLDFGYTNDPSCLVHCVIKGDELYTDELFYEHGLTNPQIGNRMEQLGVKKYHDEIFADAAEPKSIEEISQFGFNIKPAPKGADSVDAGIQKLNQYRQFVTKRSTNGIKELRNYTFIRDKNGNFTNKPIDDWNHFCDARRYAVVGKTLSQGLSYANY